MEKEKSHYSAFISYRHTDTDTAVARHIQQKLERFKAPKAIREKYGIAGFDKLFRDQEELQTGKDLSAMIQEALDHSDYLIVICSPQYSESKWCQLEVESFLEKHDPDHVLCVLSSGEPPAIFPEALMKEAEPLACDYRMNFSKADRIELPRLISAMIGCSYDELIMRQERYRKKRRTIILSILFAFAAVVIAYLLRTNAIITANYHQAQINESAMLARESQNNLAEAKRLDALNLAKEALAEGRPETDDAFYALSKAANAYVTPYQYTESWRIDPVSDIESFLLSEDGNYIICKDNQALFHTISILDHEEKASFYLGEDVLSYETRKDHQLLAYGDGSLRCVDYLSGETVFETQMKYQAIGMSTQSGSGKYIATADSYAVQVTDEQGSPFLSMPLPKDQDGYIVDLCWSGQDSFVAVKLRTSSRRYCIGVYDFETSQFSVVSQEKDEILDFVFLDDKTLCILSAEESESSFRDADHSRNYDRLYLLEVFNPYERLYAAEIRNNGIPAKTAIIKDGEICSLILSDRIYRFDRSGNLLREYSLPENVTEILFHDEESIYLVDEEGYLGILEYESGSSNFNRFFPSKISSLSVSSGNRLRDDTYVLLKDGNLQIYEAVYDSNLQILSDRSITNPPEDLITDDEHIAILSEERLLVYQLDNSYKEIEAVLETGHAYHLLKMDASNIYVLKIDAGTSYLSILSYSLEDGRLEKEIQTYVRDDYIRQGLLSYPLSREEAIFLTSVYQGLSSIYVANERIYFYEQGRLVMADLKEGSFKEFSLQETSLASQTKILLSQDEKMVYISSDSGVRICSLETGEEKILTEDSGGRMDLKEVFIYMSGEKVNIASLSGELLYEIDPENDSILSFCYHKGLLYCICSDHTLKIYREKQMIREIKLSFRDSAYLLASDFRYFFTDKRLYLYNNTGMEVISLDSDSMMPLYFVDDSVLAYMEEKGGLYLCCQDPVKRDGLYYLGFIREYDTVSLRKKAEQEIENYRWISLTERP